MCMYKLLQQLDFAVVHYFLVFCTEHGVLNGGCSNILSNGGCDFLFESNDGKGRGKDVANHIDASTKNASL